MASKMICLIRCASEISLIPQKRFRTRWLSRNPVNVLRANASEVQGEIEEKLSFERQILKESEQTHTREEPPIEGKQNDTIGSKLSAVVPGHLQKPKVGETGFTIKAKHGKLRKKENKLRRADPFGLSSVLPGEENDSDKDAGTGWPPIPDTYVNENCTETGLTETIRNSCNKDSLKASDINVKHTRSKTRRDNIKTSASQLVKPKAGDEKLRKIMLLTKSKKMREKHNLVVAEGKRLVKDFIAAGATPKMVFFSRQLDVDGICTSQNDTKFYRVPYKQLSLWTDVETSQGIIGLFDISDILRQTSAESSLPITVICDNVRDPGNMGSVLRIAAGAGCEKVILTKGCVDLWDSKVLRSAAGAHGRLPLIKDLSWEVVPEQLPDGCVTFAADNSPLQNHATPLLHYDRADFGSAPHVAVIVGGETHGLSSSALAMASARLHVPLRLGIDSLNTAVAFAIIVFEARRHMTAGVQPIVDTFQVMQ